MSGETEKNISGWTVDTLKDFLEQKITYERQLADERDKRYHERFTAQQEATKYSQEKSNEFRGALDDLSTKQATKVELNTATGTLNEKIDTLGNLTGELRSRLDVGPAGLSNLRSQIDISSGRVAGLHAGWLYLIGGAGLAGAILGIISFFR